MRASPLRCSSFFLATGLSAALIAPACVRSTGQRISTTQINAGYQDQMELIRLEAELNRQKQLFQIDAAEETAQRIADIRAAQEKKCGEVWRIYEESQRVMSDRKSSKRQMRDAARAASSVPPELTSCMFSYSAARQTQDAEDETPMLATDFRRSDLMGDLVTTQAMFTEPRPVVMAGFQDQLQTEDILGVTVHDPSGKPRVSATGPLTLLAEAGQQMRRQEFDSAARTLEGALAGLDQSSASQAWIAQAMLDTMAQVELRRGNRNAAQQRAQESVDLAVKRFGAKSEKVCTPLWYQADLLASMGDFDASIRSSEQALAIATAANKSSAVVVDALASLGVAYHRKGMIDQAIARYREGIALGERLLPAAGLSVTVLRLDLVQARANLGLALWMNGDVDGALDQFRRAVADRESTPPRGSERAALAAAASAEAEIDVLLTLEAASSHPGSSSGSPALHLLLQRKGSVLETQTRGMAALRNQATNPASDPIAALRKATAKVAPGLKGLPTDSDLPGQYAALLQQRAALTKPDTANPQALAAYQKTVAELDVQIAAIQELIANRSVATARSSSVPLPKSAGDLSKYAEKYTEALTQQRRNERETLLPRVQAALPRATVLLEMVRYQPFDPHALPSSDAQWRSARYGTYIIRPAGAPMYLDYGEAAPIDALVEEFRRALARPRSTLVGDVARRLDERLMAPVRAAVGPIEQVFIAPEGQLNLIPFGALVNETGHYLLEATRVSYLVGGRDVLKTESRTPNTGPAIVIADPAFDAIPSAAAAVGSDAPQRSRSYSALHFERLPGTAAEAEALRKIWPKAQVLTGSQATETAIKSVRSPRLLHIATHGFFLEDEPVDPRDVQPRPGAAAAEDSMLRSGLVFAGANGLRSGGDDGVLTALEATGLDLVGTELVVLSACETGVGAVRTGEGVFGLRRSFLAAGAETLVMSLWQVEDAATKALMVEYHQRLARGEGRAEALRQAQLSLLHQDNLASPFYWASFVATGATGPMK